MWRRWQVIHKICLRVVLPVLRLLPYRLSNAFLGLMGRLDLIVVPNQAKRYEQAVREAAERMGCNWNARAVSRALGRQTYRWRSRDLLLDVQSDARFDQLFHVVGRARLESALARGKGVILLANHFGSHVAIAHWLFRHEYDVRWLGERPRIISNYLTHKFQTEGPLGQRGLFLGRRSTMADGSSAVLQAARVLKAGMIVKVASDVRRTDGKVASVRFLGRMESFATSWVTLAAMTGAPVVPAFCRMDETGKYNLEFQESFAVPPAAKREGHATRWVQKAVDAIEAQVRAHPEQSNDYFFWCDAESLPAHHSYSHRNRAAS